ncbi:MAG: cysteine--tRNA ligase [bacterium]
MLKIYNTLTKKKEEFKAIENGKIKFYHCGPTVYWAQHIGNMRAMVLADLIRRSLNYLGYEVNFVRNYTDVGHLTSDEDTGEDKLEKGARRENKTPQEIAEKYIKVFEDDLRDLNAQDADIKPRATEHIQEMIGMVKTLLEKGYAYATDLAIYFDVSKARDYTKLSGQILENNISSAGKADVEDKNKKHPADFALWFFKAGTHKNALQFWKSPFKSDLVKNGDGFPGWHIECSAMAKKYLGDTLDLHMGGVEHIPVHHTNEIAQSESANGKKFVNYWLHNEHLNVNDGKMSKSEGAAWSLAEIKEKGYDPLALRYFFLNSHYRSKQNFTWEALKSAEVSLNKLRGKVIELKEGIGGQEGIEGKKSKDGEKYRNKFIAAIEYDVNIPQALAVLWEVVKADNLENMKKLNLIFDFDKVFGLGLENAKKEKKAEIPEEVNKIIKEREEARKKKNWKKADELRKGIEEMGFYLKDSNGESAVIKK